MAGRGVRLHASAIAKMEARDSESPRTIRLNEAEAAAAALGVSLTDLTKARANALAAAIKAFEMAGISASGVESHVGAAVESLKSIPGFADWLEERPELAAWVEQFNHPNLQQWLIRLGRALVEGAETVGGAE